MNCLKCRDTGVIAKVDGDIPCTCPAGDVAIFRYVSHGVPTEITGKELKKLLDEEQDAAA